MSAPVTHEEVGIIGGLLFGGGILVVGLFLLASAFNDSTPSQRRGDIGCGFWMVGIGLVFLTLVGLGAIL